MADASVAITAGAGTAIDTRTEATNGQHRQVVVLGDPATNAGVAPVDVTAGLKVDLGADNDVVCTNAGTFAVQVSSIAAGSNAIGKLASNSGVDIGDVDVLSVGAAATATLANVADTASSTTLLASNAARKAAILYNDSTVGCYVKYGATASATSFTYFLDAGESYREERYTGIIDGIWESNASGSMRVTELTA
jgi:hypothetical protein